MYWPSSGVTVGGLGSRTDCWRDRRRSRAQGSAVGSLVLPTILFLVVDVIVLARLEEDAYPEL